MYGINVSGVPFSRKATQRAPFMTNISSVRTRLLQATFKGGRPLTTDLALLLRDFCMNDIFPCTVLPSFVPLDW